jgi:hypothetical protein
MACAAHGEKPRHLPTGARHEKKTSIAPSFFQLAVIHDCLKI